MKVRDLVNLIGTCDARRIFSSISGDLTKDEAGPGKDTGLPVVGDCSISAFPLYFGLESTSSDYRVTIDQKVVGAVKDILPGGARKIEKWYCIDPQFRGYRSIPKEKVPSLTRKLGYLGNYVVVVDRAMPGGNNELEGDAVIPLLADMVLRFDESGAVKEEAIKAGCKYLNGPASLAEEMPHIALLTRGDMVIEYDFRLGQWRDVQNLPEISSLMNKTQHRDFVSICQPGRCTLSGEDVAKLVLSTQDAINMLGKKYEEHLDELLTPTRFKVLHPLDTKGFFLRMSASTVATTSVKPIAAQSISKFPVWLHDTVAEKYYELNLGLALVAQAELPDKLVSAGNLGGNCEVLYDPDASDVYTTEQLAYLAALIMKTKYPAKESEGAIAMYGCMEHLNSVFARVIIGDVCDTLPEIKGTRIENLDPDPAAKVDYIAAFGLSTSASKSIMYYSGTDSIVQAPEAMTNREIALTGECSSFPTKSLIVAKSLVKFSEANPFEVWEAGLRERLQLELVTPPDACAEFYRKAPHVNDPIREAKPSWLLLKVGDKVYTINEDYAWAELVGDKVPETHLEVGPFFCGTLYSALQDVKLTNKQLTNLLLSTAMYFVDFESAQTVYAYLYNLDAESGRWCGANAGESESCILLASPTAGVISYDPATHLWAYAPFGGEGPMFKRMGSFNYNIPDALTGKLTAEMLEDACRSLSLCAVGFRGTEAVAVPQGFTQARTVPKSAQSAKWVATFNGEDYTSLDGAWAYFDGPTSELPKNSVVDDEEFISLIIDYIYYFMKFNPDQEKQYAIFDKLFSGNLQDVLNENPDYTAEGYIWLDRDKPFSIGPSVSICPPNPDLPRKDSSSSNIMCVSMYLQSSVGMITLADFADIVCSLNNLNRVVEEFLADNPSLRISKQDAMREFVAHQGALSDALEAEVEGSTIEDPIMVVGRYGWDGDAWHLTDAKLDGSAPSVCGMEVRYNSGLRNMPLTCTQAVRALYVLTTLFWEPKPEYFVALETARKRC